MNTHRARDDETPLQLISTKRLAQLLAIEASARMLAGVLEPPAPPAE